MIIMDKKYNEVNYGVAFTIMQQLGGPQFVAMAGVYAIANLGNGVSFKFHGCRKYNYMKVILTPMDEYDIIIGRDSTNKQISFHGVYAEQLQEIFTDHTGLLTHL